MTTAHRPTFDPAKGTNNAQAPTRAYHARMLPAHTRLKRRQAGQGGAAGQGIRDFKADLALAEEKSTGKYGMGAEGLHKEIKATSSHSRTTGTEQNDRHELDGNRTNAVTATLSEISPDDEDEILGVPEKQLEDEQTEEDDEGDDEDETKALMEELEKIKRERNMEKEREMANDANRNLTGSTISSNPLLSTSNREFTVKRKWDEDVVFKHQAMKSSRQQGKNDFVNDLLRSDFHRNFMRKYCT